MLSLLWRRALLLCPRLSSTTLSPSSRCYWLSPPQHRPQVCFPLSLHLLDRHENILPTLCSTKLLHSPDEQLSSLTSLTGFFGYVAPEVIKNTSHGKPMDIWLTSMIASTCIHKRKAGSLLSLSAQPLSPTFSSAVTPLFVPTTPWPLPSKMLIPKLNFRVRAWISFLMKPSPLSDVSPPSIHSIVLPRGFMWPWLTPTPTITTTTDTPLHVDLSLDVTTWVLEQSGTALWPISGPPTNLATLLLLLLRVARARKAVVDGTTKIRRVVTQALSKEEEEKDDLGRGDTMPGFFEPAHRELLLPCTDLIGKNLDDTLTLLLVK